MDTQAGKNYAKQKIASQYIQRFEMLEEAGWFVGHRE
jgi:hypothetical protein